MIVMNYSDILLFILCAVAAAAPVPFIKYYTKTNDITWIFLTVVSYTILIYTYTHFLVNKNITTLYPTLKCASILVVVSAGLLFFNNKLDARKILGITLAVSSIYLLSCDLHESN